MLYGEYASGFTGFYKYIFPPIWISGFGFGTWQLFVNPESVTFNGVKGGAPPGVEWAFLAALLIGASLTIWIAYRLAWVRFGTGRMYVRRFAEEMDVDVRSLRSVTALEIRPRMIRIQFMDQSGRNQTVWLMPAFSWPSGALAEPHLLDELRTLVQQSRVSAA